MPDRYDVIVVGARCAGSPLAALLARQGVRLALVERVSFPRDTLSSHIFETDALAFLDRLGVIDRLRATDAPLVGRTDTRVEDVELSMDLPLRPGDVGGMASVRRTVLDPILAEAAEDAGADLRTDATVTGLLEDHGRIEGVRVSGGGGEAELRSRLVVGADGRHSTVAKLCGARRYNVTPNQRLTYWAYFEDADVGSEATFLTHRWDDRFVLAIPADSGLYQVLIWPEMSELEHFRADPDAAFIAHARTCQPIADALAGARQVGKVLGAVRWEGFFREASGHGWVLSGDAGHFKSPAPGRGIGDAFLQADSLSAAILAALGGSDEALDRAMSRWGRRRDREFAEHYWLACDLEERGPVPTVLTEILRGLNDHGRGALFLELLSHRVRPSQLLSPPRVLGATRRLLARRHRPPRAPERDRLARGTGHAPAMGQQAPGVRMTGSSRLVLSVAAVAVGLQIALSALAPWAMAETPVLLDPRGVSVAAYGGWAAWSRADATTGHFALVTRSPQGAVSLPTVAESASPFDIELGPSAGTGVAAVYSRCADTVALKGCKVVELALGSAVASERTLVPPGGGSTHEPAIWNGGLAFLRRNPSGGSRRPDSLLVWKVGSRRVQALPLPSSRGNGHAGWPAGSDRPHQRPELQRQAGRLRHVQRGRDVRREHPLVRAAGRSPRADRPGDGRSRQRLSARIHLACAVRALALCLPARVRSLG